MKIVTFFKQPTVVAIALFVLINAVMYGPSLTPSFSSDEYRHLELNTFENPIKALSVFTEYDIREWRPIVRYSLWLNYLMSENAFSFKLTNYALHIGCVIVLFLLLKNCTRNPRMSFWACVVFSIVPIHSASVNWIMGRTDIFFSFFYVLCLFF